LVVDAALEAGWAPVDELDGALGLDRRDSGVDILWHNVTTVHQAARHVLTVTWVALNHHHGWLEHGVRDLSNRQLLVVGLLRRDDWRVRGEREMDTWVWHQVRLELGDIDVEGTIETEGGRQRGDNLTDKTVKVGVRWALNVEGTTADVIQRLVVNKEGHVSVLQKGVRRQNGIVWLNNGRGHLWGWVHGEGELGLFAVIDGETLEEEGTETGTGTATDGVEDHEALETSALVSKLADAVEGEVDNFLTDGVVTTGEVIGGIFLAGDQLLRVEQLAVGTSADFIDHSWLEIEEDATWNVLAGTRLGEEGVEGIIATTDGLVGWHLAIWLDTVLKAEELPAGVTGLDTGLANVDTDALTHG
jgi:hypothetical protein